MKSRWYIKQDRFKSTESDEIDSFTITTNPEFSGWRTDSGYEGYGLPKELAQWICDILNQSEEDPPFIRNNGIWTRNE